MRECCQGQQELLKTISLNRQLALVSLTFVTHYMFTAVHQSIVAVSCFISCDQQLLRSLCWLVGRLVNRSTKIPHSLTATVFAIGS